MRPSQQTHTIVFGRTTSKSPESHPCERLLGDAIDAASKKFVCCVCGGTPTHPCHPPPLYRFQEEHSIMSMVVSNDGTYLLLNLLNQVRNIIQTLYTIPANMSSGAVRTLTPCLPCLLCSLYIYGISKSAPSCGGTRAQHKTSTPSIPASVVLIIATSQVAAKVCCMGLNWGRSEVR